MSRLTELLARLDTKDPDLAVELREQVKPLLRRKSFGLTFEHHEPETVLLPGRRVRRSCSGGVVVSSRIPSRLPPHGGTREGAGTRPWAAIATSIR